MNLQIAYDTCLKNGGVTYNLNGELNPEHGYMVATKGNEESHSSISPDLVAEYVKRHADLLTEPNKFLGVWFDGTNWVFDVSELFEEKRQALFFGIIRKQKAIWDNKGRKEVRIV